MLGIRGLTFLIWSFMLLKFEVHWLHTVQVYRGRGGLVLRVVRDLWSLIVICRRFYWESALIQLG